MQGIFTRGNKIKVVILRLVGDRYGRVFEVSTLEKEVHFRKKTRPNRIIATRAVIRIAKFFFVWLVQFLFEMKGAEE
jgi:hypothetical protein